MGPLLSVPLKATAEADADLLVQPISLLSLYDFLKAYRIGTGDLDQLYEKNVRRFLGSRGRVNQAMQKTLKEAPERFGLYNNGITIVVRDFHADGDGMVVLVEPYVVNGCQTTRTIWEVCHQRLEAGGTGSDPDLQVWRDKVARGVVVAKIVKVGSEGEELLQAITRYTNSQNAVREKDFLALTSDFRAWARQMADKYDVFLEIQRGGWDSQRAQQRQKPSIKQFTEWANAFDLLKAYGAGWIHEAGTAFGRNAAFLPNGSIFKRIMNGDSLGAPFGVDDLYAAFDAATGRRQVPVWARGAENESTADSLPVLHGDTRLAKGHRHAGKGAAPYTSRPHRGAPEGVFHPRFADCKEPARYCSGRYR